MSPREPLYLWTTEVKKRAGYGVAWAALLLTLLLSAACGGEGESEAQATIPDDSSGGTQFAPREAWKDSASWSPDGKRIALVRGPEKVCGGDIYVVTARGGKPERITRLADSESGSGLESPIWSPDGKKIAFVHAKPGFQDMCGEFDIDVMRADGEGRTTLGRGFFFYGACHSWSPDGRRLMFVKSGDPFDWVVVMNADGTKPRRLARASSGEGCPVWSPDGQEIAFVRGKGRSVLTGVFGEVYLVGLNGDEKRLTRTHGTAESPIWAPDGSGLAFIASDVKHRSSIWMVRPDGSGQRRIVQEGKKTLTLYDLTWSPDGRTLAYNRDVYGGGDDVQLIVFRRDGSDRRTLVDLCCVAWSPDGTKLAVGKVGSDRTYVVRADQLGLTGELRPLTKY